MSGEIAVFAILAAIAGGIYAYKRLGEGPADAGYDAVATLSSILWIITGITLVAGGFVLAGVVVITLFTYIGTTKGTATGDRIRRRLNG